MTPDEYIALHYEDFNGPHLDREALENLLDEVENDPSSDERSKKLCWYLRGWIKTTQAMMGMVDEISGISCPVHNP